MTTAEAYEIAAEWHDKQARACRSVVDDWPRIGADAAERALQAAKHHAASAAGLRNAALGLRKKGLVA